MTNTTESQYCASTEASVIEVSVSESIATSPGQVEPTNVPAVTTDAAEEFNRQNDIVKKGAAAFIEVGQALRKIQDDDLWKAGGYSTWECYCDAALDASRSYVRRLIKASGVALEFRANVPIGTSSEAYVPMTEAQVRPLLRLKDPEQRTEAWTAACGNASGPPTAVQVTEAVLALLPAKEKPATKPAKLKALAPVVLPTAQAAVELVTRLKDALTTRDNWDECVNIANDIEALLAGGASAA